MENNYEGHKEYLRDENIIKQFNDFINTRLYCNKWLEGDKMKVYVRKGKRCFKGLEYNYYNCIDIATLEVYDQKDYGKGYMSSFMQNAIKMCKEIEYMIYVENILTISLANSLEKRFSFQKYNENNDISICLYKTF